MNSKFKKNVMKKNVTLFFALFSIIVHAQNFNPGNIIVTQIGDGTTTLSGNTAAVRLLEFAPTGSGQSPVKTVSLNSGSGTKLVLTGTTQSEGQLSLSSNGKYLSLIGYNIPTAEVTTNNCVSNAVTVTNGGSGYTSVPTVTISAPNIAGGVQATAGALRSGSNTISGIYLTNNGSGYTSVPTITITGGGGTGATATASLQSPYWWGSAITKTIARIDNAGTADYSTSISTNPSSSLMAAKQAVSVDGSAFWTSTNTLDYIVFGSSTKTNISTSIYPLGMAIYNNRLFLGGEKTWSNISYYASMPTTATAPTSMVVQSSNNYQSIVLFDLDPTANWNGTGYDVMYIGDYYNSLRKYYWNGTTWTNLGATWIGANGSFSQIIGKLNSSGQPVIYGISSITGTGSSSNLISVTDAAAYNVAMISSSFNTLATASSNYAFRGLAFAPYNSLSTQVTEKYNFNAKVFSVKDGVIIQSASKQPYKIISTLGQQMAEGICNVDNQFIPISQKGIYIVQINKSAMKVLIND